MNRLSTMVLILVTLASWPAMAKCMAAATWIWPDEDARLPTNNAVILVEGFGNDREAVWSVENGKAALVSGSDRVPLKAWRRARGEFQLVQVALSPVRPLREGLKYTLELPFKGPTRTWLATGVDHEAPIWDGPPTVAGHFYTVFGCGPEAEVHLQLPLRHSDRHLVLVTVTDEKQAEDRTYIVRPHEGRIALGHGMCSGPFRLEPGQKFSTRLVAIDVAGNMSAAPGADPKFHGPGPSDPNRPLR